MLVPVTFCIKKNLRESSAEETEDTAIQDSTEGNAEAAEEIAEETTTVEPTEPAPAA